MKIFIKAKPNSKIEKVEKIDEKNFVVFVKESPEKGRANEAIMRVLAKHFGVAKSQVKIRVGQASRNKIIEII